MLILGGKGETIDPFAEMIVLSAQYDRIWSFRRINDIIKTEQDRALRTGRVLNGKGECYEETSDRDRYAE